MCVQSTHERRRSRNQMCQCPLQLPDAYMPVAPWKSLRRRIYPGLDKVATIIADRTMPHAIHHARLDLMIVDVLEVQCILTCL